DAAPAAPGTAFEKKLAVLRTVEKLSRRRRPVRLYIVGDALPGGRCRGPCGGGFMSNLWNEMAWRRPVTGGAARLSAVVSFIVTITLATYRLRLVQRRLRAQRAAYAQKKEDEVALVLCIGKLIDKDARDYLDKNGCAGITTYSVHRHEPLDESKPA